MRARLDRFAPADSHWPIADAPTGGASRALVIAGYQSTSWQHWHPTARIYTASALNQTVTAVSYNGFAADGTGQHYAPPDTERDLQITASVLADYVSRVASGSSVVGISMGSVAAILGTAERLADPAASDTKPIRRLILVAPAISPPELLYRHYEERAKNPALLRVIPPCIEQLCRKGSGPWEQMRHALATSFEVIRAASVPVSVVYWPGDLLTPSNWLDRLQLNIRRWVGEIPLPTDELGLADLPLEPPVGNSEYFETIVTQHRKFFEHRLTVERVRNELAKPT